MLPDEADDGLIGGDRRKTKVTSVTVIPNGSRDTEEPRNVTDRVLQLSRHFAEAAEEMMVKTCFMMPWLDT